MNVRRSTPMLGACFLLICAAAGTPNEPVAPRESEKLAAMADALVPRADPTTRPAVVNAGQAYQLERATAAAAEIAFSAVRERHEAATHSSSEWQAAYADVVRAQAALETARSSPDLQGRMDCSSRFNKARERLRAIEIASDKFSPDYVAEVNKITSSRTKLAAANRKLADAKTAAEQEVRAEQLAKESSDPIAAAVRRREIVLGMKLEQAKALSDVGAKMTRDSLLAQEWEFSLAAREIDSNTSTGTIDYECTLRGGIIVVIDKYSHPFQGSGTIEGGFGGTIFGR